MITSSSRILLTTTAARFFRSATATANSSSSAKPNIFLRQEFQQPLLLCRSFSATFQLGQTKEELSEEARKLVESMKDPPHPIAGKKTKVGVGASKADVLVVDGKELEDEFSMPHPIWSPDEAEKVSITHRTPVGFSDKLAYATISAMRKIFDILSGYSIGKHLDTIDERTVLTRCLFLETVAGVPGFAAAMIRHLQSLRSMRKDHGWIHTLLEEAENERMHLMTFMQLRRPGPLFRYSVIGTQWVFTFGFSLCYIISPNFCHRFVGYLEEQAVVTYTSILKDMDDGKLPMLQGLAAPEVAIVYWQLPEDAMMRDVFLAIRADEAHHRIVNHTLGSMNLKEKNPFKPGT